MFFSDKKYSWSYTFYNFKIAFSILLVYRNKINFIILMSLYLATFPNSYIIVNNLFVDLFVISICTTILPSGLIFVLFFIFQFSWLWFTLLHYHTGRISRIILNKVVIVAVVSFMISWKRWGLYISSLRMIFYVHFCKYPVICISMQ